MIIYFFAYLSAHFLVYALVLRHRPAFHRERPIFLYHVLPAIAVAMAAVGSLIADPSSDRLMQAVFLLAAQGIYSLSFLELWSLTQGGYSIRILQQMESAQPADPKQFGASKKQDRLEGLRGLRLVRPTADGCTLTVAGQIAAGFLNAVRWIAQVRESG